MLETFFRTHRYLLEHLGAPVRRALMDEINWRDRLIGIKGSRGVGKSRETAYGCQMESGQDSGIGGKVG